MKVSAANGSLYSFQISGISWKEASWKFMFNSDETSLYFTARLSSNKTLKYSKQYYVSYLINY